MKKILFVCLGNICRSPMAEFVFKDVVASRGLEGCFTCTSAATSAEETGNPIHSGTQRTLRAQGIPFDDAKHAKQMTKADYQAYDLLIGMEAGNLRAMNRICGGDPDGKMSRLLDFTSKPRDIADPWYTGRFDDTYRDVCEGCEALIDWLCAGTNVGV